MKELAKIFGVIFTVGFFLNFGWEVAQAELYRFSFGPWYDFILMHVRVSLGDVGFILLIYFAGAAINRGWNWFIKLTTPKILFILLSGFVIGIVVEKINLLAGRWSYNPDMPMLPYLHVGLSPVLQMTVLPLTTFLIARELI